MKLILSFVIFLTASIAYANNFKSISYRNVLVMKKMKKKHAKIISKYINESAKKYNIDPKIILAIIKLESNFNQHIPNKMGCKYVNFRKDCGDYSIAQINYLIWKEEFSRKGESLDLVKLKKFNYYAIDTMGRILKVLKKRHSRKDPLWFLRYNSNKLLKRVRYFKLLESPLKKANIPYLNISKNKEKLLFQAVNRYGWKRVMAIFTNIKGYELKI